MNLALATNIPIVEFATNIQFQIDHWQARGLIGKSAYYLMGAKHKKNTNNVITRKQNLRLSEGLICGKIIDVDIDCVSGKGEWIIKASIEPANPMGMLLLDGIRHLTLIPYVYQPNSSSKKGLLEELIITSR